MDIEITLLYGLVGGIASEALKWFLIREELHRGIHDYAKKWPYWLVTVVMIGIGGLLACAHQVSSDIRLTPLLAANIGASAPLILSALVSRAPQLDPGTID